MHFSTRKRTDNNHTLVTTPPAYLVCLLWRAPFCSRTYHGSTSRTRRVISVVGASRLLAPASRSQPSPSQSPLTSHPRLRLPLSARRLLSAPSLISPHLSRTSPPPPTTTLRTLFRPSRHHHRPYTRSSTPTANHHLLNHHTRSGGRARPAPFSLTPPDRHRPSTLTAHQQ